MPPLWPRSRNRPLRTLALAAMVVGLGTSGPALLGQEIRLGQDIDLNRGWQPLWPPFHSELSAEGFASRLGRVTGLDYRVTETGPGRYQVAVAYLDEQERRAAVALIEAKTGLQLEERDL